MAAVSRLVAAILLALCPASAWADPFTILPSGDVAFNVALRTTGTFACASSFVSCSASGNTITLGNGPDTATLIFSGVTSTVQASGLVSLPILLGQVEATSSEGFTFPQARHPVTPVFTFRLTIEHTSPVAETQSIGWRLGPGGGAVIHAGLGGGDWLLFSAGESPFQYGLAYDFDPFRGFLANGTRDITATLGAVPEPSTLALLGTGVVGLLLRKRTRQPDA